MPVELSLTDRSRLSRRIIGDETTGSKLGVVPQPCKDGDMGNRNLYHFCLAIIIFLDITVPLALLAAAAKSGLRSTLSFYPIPAAPVEQPPPAEKEVHVFEKSVATTMYVGQA